MIDKVAVVTGSNKGIGFGIVRELCRRGVKVVYLTARDIKRGKEAIKKLKEEGFNPIFYQLDITDKKNVENFAKHLKQQHSSLDILINNAATIPEDFSKTTYVEAKRVIDVNYRSYCNIQDYLFPLLSDNARVVNVSSDCGHISNLKNTYWVEILTKQNLEIKEIDEFVDWFLESVQNNTLNENDFAATVLLAYRISKIAICALTRVQQATIGRNISINSLHPGFVKTDMTMQHGDLSIDESSQAPVYLALDCDQSLKGKFIWYDKNEVDWTDPNVELKCQDKEEADKYFEAVSKT